MIINADDFDSVDEAIKSKIMDPVVASVDVVRYKDTSPLFSKQPKIVYSIKTTIISNALVMDNGRSVNYDVTIKSRDREKLAKYTVGVK